MPVFRPLILGCALATCASAATAEITHRFDARFGVGYVHDPRNPQGRMQPLYEGRYTSTLTRETDNGILFRFELGVVMSNFESARPFDDFDQWVPDRPIRD